MAKFSILFIFLVSMLNIALNTSLKITAEKAGGNFVQGLFSLHFAVAFMIGTSSALSLLALYSSGVELARGILLMGAVSILGGTLFGVFFYNNRLNTVEWLIFGLLSFLLLWRFIMLK